MFGQIYFRVLGIGCFLSMALLSSAQSKLDSLHHLNEVVVTARINKEVIPVQSLSGDKLEKLAAHSVADAIRYFSGVQIKDYGGIGGLKTVNIRSMGTNHVGVFYDGIELGNAQNGVIDLGRFSLDNMEAVTLYNGQKSAIFQPAKDFGSAGSIYLQSRTPVFREDRAYHVKATFKTGSFGVVNPSLLWEQKLSENVSASLSTEYMYTTGKYKFTYAVDGGYDTTAVRRNGDVNALRAEGGLYGKIKSGYWRTKAYFYNSERGYPGAVVRNRFSHEDRQWDTNFFFQSSFKKDFGDVYSLLLNAKYAYDYLHYLADPQMEDIKPEIHSRISNRIALFEEIFNTLKAGYSNENLHYASSLFHYYLGSLKYIQQYRNAGAKEADDSNVVDIAIHYMKENIEKHLTLQEISEHLGYSASHFSMLFRKKTGHSPLSYFNLLKIQQACFILDSTDMKINQVCYKIGIEDSYYFSRLFHKIMGISPKEYRKKQKG